MSDVCLPAIEWPLPCLLPNTVTSVPEEENSLADELSERDRARERKACLFVFPVAALIPLLFLMW
jgi:predicted nucleic acid-binding Zn ribbon protein